MLETEKQKDNLAKFLYDIAKIDFAAFVVARISKFTEFTILDFIIGILATIIPIIVALILDGKEMKQ
ncbi:MAG: hypothetical protein HZA00_13405 [Nitrospinae bacterium]|nr:hypothetical protein [Nitrospinota bacterium]